MKRKIMEAMEYMDQKYIDEAMEPRKNFRKPLVRWAAIAACLVLVVGLCLGWFGGKEEIVLPPTRYGAGTASASLARGYTLEEAIAEADAVVWVRVGNWLGEREVPMPCTFFDAEVVQCFKGDIPETFVLKQLGSSKFTFNVHPLFTNGNEFLLFLNHADLEIDNEEYDDCYIILGAYCTVMDIAQDSNGEVYVSDRMGVLCEYLDADNLAGKEELKKELCEAIQANDEIQAGYIGYSKHLYTLSSLMDLLCR